MSVKDAMMKHHQKLHDKQVRQSSRAGKKNAKPEKVLEKQILKWALETGLNLHVIEAKAVYSVAAGQYLRGNAEAGLPDLIGNYEGLSVWIELKSKGRKGTLKAHQRAFLTRKIAQGCFAVCVDSVEDLDSIFQSYVNMKPFGHFQLLTNHLPTSRKATQTDGGIF